MSLVWLWELGLWRWTGELGELEEEWEKVGPGLAPEECSLLYLLPSWLSRGGFWATALCYGTSPTPKRLTPGGRVKHVAELPTALGRTKRMCASRRPEWEHSRERRGLAGMVLWHLITHPPPLPVLPTGWICLQDAGEAHTSQPPPCPGRVGQPQRSLCPEAKLGSRPDGISGELTHAGQACTWGRCL